VININRYEKAIKLDDKKFKQLFGVNKETFAAMLVVLQAAYDEKHKRRGRKPKLCIADQLFLSLKYWRQYLTQAELAYEFDVSETTAHDTILWVENTLINSGLFGLPGKKALYEDAEIEIVLVDVVESPIERPKKNRSNGIPAKRSGTL